MDKEIFSMWDLPYKRSHYKEDIGSYDYNIENQTRTQLEAIAQKIYDELTNDVDIWRENLRCDAHKVSQKEERMQNEKSINNVHTKSSR